MDKRADFLERGIGNSRRVGPHISYQSDGAFGTQLDAFVQTLCYAHRLLHREAEFSSRILLELRCDKGWRRVAFALFCCNGVDEELFFLSFGNDLVRLFRSTYVYFGCP